VSHGKDPDGKLVVRVRWAGYDSVNDTWENPCTLPPDVVRRYECRKKVRLLP
jgi:hypothetical protein